jgi:CRP/FNR family transcriptional regulator, anaerobic regulatory protein
MQSSAFAHLHEVLLTNVPTLSDVIWQRMLSLGTYHAVPKKSLLLWPGEVATKMHFLHKGLLRAYFPKNGDDLTYYFFSEGQFVTAYTSFLTAHPSRMFIEALEDCELITYAKTDVEQLQADHHEIERFSHRMSQQTYLLLDARMSDFQFKSLEERYGTFVEQYAHVLQRVPQHIIASYLGVKPESLSRIRQRLLRGSQGG